MSEQDSVHDAMQGAGANATAGEMLRAARMAHGIHIAALAASIKVTVKKLEALEGDRIDELPDSTFARALAQAVCRFLKIDPAPILAKLPGPRPATRLEHVAQGLNQPFRDTTIRREPFVLDTVARPAIWVPALLVVGAIVIWLLPPGVIKPMGGGETPPGMVTDAASGPVLPPTEPAGVRNGALRTASGRRSFGTGPSAAAPATIGAAPAAPTTDAAGGAIVLRTTAQSWVEVVDGSGRTLISRLIPAGETVSLDGSFPMRVKVGNAKGTQVDVRGAPFDMGPHVRDNVARFEVK